MNKFVTLLVLLACCSREEQQPCRPGSLFLRFECSAIPSSGLVIDVADREAGLLKTGIRVPSSCPASSSLELLLKEIRPRLHPRSGWP